jgi:hypothetical protein
MSNDDVESLVARDDAPPTPPVEDVLDAQRDTATTGIVSQDGPLDVVDEHPGPKAEPASAALINNTGDDGGAGSG